jgi:hypothetical protein
LRFGLWNDHDYFCAEVFGAAWQMLQPYQLPLARVAIVDKNFGRSFPPDAAAGSEKRSQLIAAGDQQLQSAIAFQVDMGCPIAS